MSSKHPQIKSNTLFEGHHFRPRQLLKHEGLDRSLPGELWLEGDSDLPHVPSDFHLNMAACYDKMEESHPCKTMWAPPHFRLRSRVPQHRWHPFRSKTDAADGVFRGGQITSRHAGNCLDLLPAIAGKDGGRSKRKRFVTTKQPLESGRPATRTLNKLQYNDTQLANGTLTLKMCCTHFAQWPQRKGPLCCGHTSKEVLPKEKTKFATGQLALNYTGAEAKSARAACAPLSTPHIHRRAYLSWEAWPTLSGVSFCLGGYYKYNQGPQRMVLFLLVSLQR